MSERLPLAAVLARQREAWRRGQPCRVEQLLDEHAHLAGDDDAVLDLIYAERLLREEGGAPATLEEYLGRFPRLAAPLRAMFEVDESITSGLTPEEAYKYSTVDGAAGQPALPEPVPRLDGLEMLGELGRGAMGVVYRGWQKSARRPVAVKVLDADVPAARARTEAEAAARLSHPNIAQTYEVRQHGDRTVLVLEYVEGGNLAQKIAGRPQPPRDAARFVEALAWAMAYAHARGVIHRDLKPSNVLLSAGPDAPLAACVPKISDFGLAKLIEGGLDVTRSNEMLGTPSYMPPEQASGGGGKITPATDVWAMGAILYELLTGRAPFLGEGLLETIDQVLHQDPVPPSSLQPTVPHDLEVITLKCLHKAPARRYETARELADDLRRFQAGEPILARSVGRAERAWKWSRRHPTAAVLLAVLVLTAAAALAAGLGVNRALREQRDLAREQARELATELRQRRQLQYTANLLRVGTVWPGDPEQGLRLLEDEAAFPAEMRCFSWRALRHGCGRYRERVAAGGEVTAVAAGGEVEAVGTASGEVLLWRAGSVSDRREVRIKRHTGPVTAVALRGDGKLIASGGADGRVKVWHVDGSPAGEMTTAGAVAALAWHPDGRRLAVSAGGEVALYEAPSLRPVRSFTTAAHPRSGVALSPDGTALACGGVDHAVLLFTVATGAAWVPGRGHEGAVTALAFAPGGRALYTGGRDGLVKVWAMRGEAVHARDSLAAAVGPVAALAAHPRRAALAVGGEGGDERSDVEVIELAEGRRDARRGHGGCRGVAFGRDGARLITGGADGSVARWDDPLRPAELRLSGSAAPGRIAVARQAAVVAWLAAEGAYARALAGGAARLVVPAEHRSLQAIALSPDGQRLVTSAGAADEPGALLLWDVASGRLLRSLSHGVAITAVAFAPGGGRVYFGDRDGAVAAWELPGGEQTAIAPASGRPVRMLAVSGDGRRVVGVGAAVVVWGADTGREVARLAEDKVTAVALDGEGRSLAVAAGGEVRLVEVDTGAARATGRMGLSEISFVSFSHDGAALAVAGRGAGVRLWDVATWQERAALPGHGGGATFAGFAAGGDVLVTVAAGGRARLWYGAP